MVERSDRFLWKKIKNCQYGVTTRLMLLEVIWSGFSDNVLVTLRGEAMSVKFSLRRCVDNYYQIGLQ
jgi:hypothetical protein